MTLYAYGSYLRSTARTAGWRAAAGEARSIARRKLGGLRIRYGARPDVQWGRHMLLDGALDLRGYGAITFGESVHVLVATGQSTTLAVERPEARIEIGDNVAFSGTTIVCSTTITIGDRSMLGPVQIIDSDYHAIRPEGRRKGARGLRAPIVVGADCWLCSGAVILRGVTIGDGSVIGAGAVVRDDVPPRSLVAGNPAEVVARIP